MIGMRVGEKYVLHIRWIEAEFLQARNDDRFCLISKSGIDKDDPAGIRDDMNWTFGAPNCVKVVEQLYGFQIRRLIVLAPRHPRHTVEVEGSKVVAARQFLCLFDMRERLWIIRSDLVGFSSLCISGHSKSQY